VSGQDQVRCRAGLFLRGPVRAAGWAVPWAVFQPSARHDSGDLAGLRP
jgi:hypothetical protein